MIDLHSHILPGVDDGAKSLVEALAMARIAVADGITMMACTPHIYPGLYENDSHRIRGARDALQRSLQAQGIPLQLTTGADVHLVPGVLTGLVSGGIPCLHNSRYLLLEPPHHVCPPRFAESVFQLVAAGYVPVITHPERLSWIEHSYEMFIDLTRQGAWMQVTAGSLSGVFGPRAKYWGERLLGDGLTHLLATDAHSSNRRVPVLSEGRAIAERLLGREEAQLLVEGRQAAILKGLQPSEVAQPPAQVARAVSWWRSLAKRLA